MDAIEKEKQIQALLERLNKQEEVLTLLISYLQLTLGTHTVNQLLDKLTETKPD